MGPSARRRTSAVLGCLLVTAAALLCWPSPEKAEANVACDVGSAPIGAVTGAVGFGNPVGDACNSVSGSVTAPVTGAVSGALKDVGSSVFGQMTTWVSEGAGWLMGQVVNATDETTTPQLDTEGFLTAYGRMAAIAAVMACAMLLLAVLEGIAQGSPGLLARVVLINVPLAFLGTSIAFAVVQLLLGVTDGMSAAMAGASHHDSTKFFEAAIGDLKHVGGQVGETAGGKGTPSGTVAGIGGSVAVPLFVSCLAALIGALAAFFVWVELLFRDTAVYVVALFMPLALAASIWPRWTGALRKTGENLLTLIGSKFVIVAIVSLAASLVSEESGSVEHILAAATLMTLACFSPFVLMRLIPFSEGAMAAAYGRRSAAGGAVSAVQTVSNVAMLRSMTRSGEGSGVSLWGAEGAGGSGDGKGVEGGGSGANGAIPGRGSGDGGGPSTTAATAGASGVETSDPGGSGSERSGGDRGGGSETSERPGVGAAGADSGTGKDAGLGPVGSQGSGGGGQASGASAAGGAASGAETGGAGAVAAGAARAVKGAAGSAGRTAEAGIAGGGQRSDQGPDGTLSQSDAGGSRQRPSPETSHGSASSEGSGAATAPGQSPPRPSPEPPTPQDGADGEGSAS